MRRLWLERGKEMGIKGKKENGEEKEGEVGGNMGK